MSNTLPGTNSSANQFTSDTFLDPYGVFMPQKRREMIYFQSEEYFSLDIFQELRMTEPVKGQQFSFFVEPKKIVNLIAAETVAAGATNAAVTFSIQQTPGILNHIYARGRETLRRKSGQQLLVVAVDTSAYTITVKAKTGGAVEAITTGEVFTIVGNASPEASSPRTPLTGVPREVYNQLQIFQEIAQGSGSIQEQATWIPIAEAEVNGQAVSKKYWFAWEISAAWDRLTNQRATAMIASKKEEYTVDFSTYTSFGSQATGTIPTTGGVIDQYVAEGNSEYYTNGSLDFTWYNGLENTLIKNFGDRENIMFSGVDFTHQNSSWIIDMFKNGAITYGAFNQSASKMADVNSGVGNSAMVDGKELAIKMGFQSFSTPTGFTWHWKNLAEFVFPDGLGALGFGYNAIVIPTQPFRTSQGNMSKVVRSRYKMLPNGGQVATGFRNSTRNSSTPNSAGDFDSIEMITEEGIEVLAPWKGLFIQPQN